MIHKGTCILETERLILRKFKIEDAKNMYKNWVSSEDVVKYLTWPAHSNIETTENILKTWIERYTSLDTYNWAIELKEIGEPIGDISVVSINERVNSCEIGYCLSREHWNKGIVTEAFKAVIKYLLIQCDFNRVVATHHVDNKASGKVMLKSGLKHEGTLRDGSTTRKGLCDIEIYAILKRDWIKDNIVIREIQEKDNKIVENIIRTCLIEFGANKKGTAWEDKDLGIFSKVYVGNGKKFFVAEVLGKVIGCGGIGPVEGVSDTCELQKMYFLKGSRGLGLAQKVLDECLKYAKEYYCNCYLETLTNMEAAQKFYIKNGFNRICSPVGNTGHCSCDTWYIKEL